MWRKIIFFIGLVLFLLSMAVFVVSLLLPIVNAPRTTWEEAAIGIIPGALCSMLSFVIAVVGLILWLIAPAPAKPGRRDRADDDWEEEDDRPRRRK
jgi:hypothetical protein